MSARVAFLGLGRMGRGMAGRLLTAGFEVRVYNRTRARAEALASAGARVCDSAAQASEGAQAIFGMSADDEASAALWEGPQGALAGVFAPGAFAIECSTLSHDRVLALAAKAGAAGLRYIDAPVTGLPDAAAAGTLTLFVGAGPADLEAARPYLAPLCERILPFGGVGAGTVYKLMINLVGAIQIASAAEGLVLARAAGLDLGAVADAVTLGQAASPQVVRNTRRMVQDAHDRDVVFTAALRRKDVTYALALAKKLGVASPFGHVAGVLLDRLCADGGAALNESKIFDVVAALGRAQAEASAVSPPAIR